MYRRYKNKNVNNYTVGTDRSFEYFALFMNILDTSPRNENLNLLV